MKLSTYESVFLRPDAETLSDVKKHFASEQLGGHRPRFEINAIWLRVFFYVRSAAVWLGITLRAKSDVKTLPDVKNTLPPDSHKPSLRKNNIMFARPEVFLRPDVKTDSHVSIYPR